MNVLHFSALAQHFGELIARNRWAIQKALTLGSPVLHQEMPVGIEFDSLGEHVEF
jgi:hypothetical protein